MSAAIQASHFKVGSRSRARRALCGFQDPKVLISVPSVTTQDSALPLGRAARLRQCGILASIFYLAFLWGRLGDSISTTVDRSFLMH